MFANVSGPDSVKIFADNNKNYFAVDSRLAAEDLTLECMVEKDAVNVFLTADTTRVKFIRLRWNITMPEGGRYMADSFERTYGASGWQSMDASRYMPWYFLFAKEKYTCGIGVKVRPAAFCFWQADAKGVTLWLDVRNGTYGVNLNGRKLELCNIIFRCYEKVSAFAAHHLFCAEMSPSPLLPSKPVYGSNNWYYAYGQSSYEDIISDAKYLCSLTTGLTNRPYMVIDDGWQKNGPYKPGPWTAGNEKFPDIKRLAEELVALDVIPGIWFRPLRNAETTIPAECRLARNREFLDPSHPLVLEQIGRDVKCLSDFGYRLLKHDFSTWDTFGKWGFEMTPLPTSGKWHFYDDSKTAAEIIQALYRTILTHAGDALILGCNTINHLGAGLMQLARVGDDTSGKSWERSRKMGVNTLAFRMGQHRNFFDNDADCIGITGAIPWYFNEQWSRLLAASGTAFFASIKPGLLNPEEFKLMQQYFALASRQETVAEPLDWMDNVSPTRWLINGRETVFDWTEEQGATPDFVMAD